MHPKISTLSLCLLVFAFLATGCSGDSVVSPSTPSTMEDATGTLNSALEPATACHIYGNVRWADGSPAPGRVVVIEVGTSPLGMHEVWRGATGSFGEFHFDTYLWQGANVRVITYGDQEVRIYNGVSAYMYFALTTKRAIKNDYDLDRP